MKEREEDYDENDDRCLYPVGMQTIIVVVAALAIILIKTFLF